MKKNAENDEEEDIVRFFSVHTIKLKNTIDDNEEIPKKKDAIENYYFYILHK